MNMPASKPKQVHVETPKTHAEDARLAPSRVPHCAKLSLTALQHLRATVLQRQNTIKSARTMKKMVKIEERGVKKI